MPDKSHAKHPAVDPHVPAPHPHGNVHAEVVPEPEPNTTDVMVQHSVIPTDGVTDGLVAPDVEHPAVPVPSKTHEPVQPDVEPNTTKDGDIQVPLDVSGKTQPVEARRTIAESIARDTAPAKPKKGQQKKFEFPLEVASKVLLMLSKRRQGMGFIGEASTVSSNGRFWGVTPDLTNGVIIVRDNGDPYESMNVRKRIDRLWFDRGVGDPGLVADLRTKEEIREATKAKRAEEKGKFAEIDRQIEELTETYNSLSGGESWEVVIDAPDTVTVVFP